MFSVPGECGEIPESIFDMERLGTKKTHDLEDLLAFCIDFGLEFENLKEECGLLNEYITEARYPGDMPFESIAKDDAREAIEAAHKIEQFVLRKIDLPFENKENNLEAKERK